MVNSQAKTVVLLLTERRPNVQVNPSRGRRTTSATNIALCIRKRILSMTLYIYHHIGMAKNYLAVFSFMLSSFFCFMKLCLLFQRTRKVSIRNTTLIYKIMLPHNNSKFSSLETKTHAAYRQEVVESSKYTLTIMTANIGTTKPNIVPLSAESQQLLGC